MEVWLASDINAAYIVRETWKTNKWYQAGEIPEVRGNWHKKLWAPSPLRHHDHQELHTLFPCSCLRSLPQEAALQERLQCGSFPWAAVPRGLLHQKSLSQGHNSYQQTCFSMTSSPWSMSARHLFQHRLPMTSQPPLGTHLSIHSHHTSCHIFSLLFLSTATFFFFFFFAP